MHSCIITTTAVFVDKLFSFRSYFVSQSQSLNHHDDVDPMEELLSDYESGSPPSQGELGDGSKLQLLDTDSGGRTLYNRSTNTR